MFRVKDALLFKKDALLLSKPGLVFRVFKFKVYERVQVRRLESHSCIRVHMGNPSFRNFLLHLDDKDVVIGMVWGCWQQAIRTDEEKMEIDGKRILRLIVVLWLIGGTIYFIGIPWFKVDKQFLNSAYNEKIKRIEIRSGHRGHAHILVDTTWRLLQIDEVKIQDYIQPGDSIVKQHGTRTITIFRRTDNGVISKSFD